MGCGASSQKSQAASEEKADPKKKTNSSTNEKKAGKDKPDKKNSKEETDSIEKSPKKGNEAGKQDQPKSMTATTLLDEYVGLLTTAGAFGDTAAIGAVSKDDVLIVVDMQNDFLPGDDAPKGGRFGVAEGGSASAVIVPLIAKFAAAGAMIIATRDYHPKDHASFNNVGGPFPEHCLQGGAGSEFFPPIAEALTLARSGGADVRVVFKGFSESVDSFGGFTYPEDYASGRLTHSKGTGAEAHPSLCAGGEGIGCSLPFTGAFEMKQSSVEESINAPPDVLAVLNRKPLKDVVAGKRRAFVCGLAMDFCVLDTAVTASAGKVFGDGVYILMDAARAANIHGVGAHGSGFLTDPATFAETTKKYDLRLRKTTDLP